MRQKRPTCFDLARAGNTTLRTRRRTAPPRIRPSVQRILDVITDAPAYVRNARRDILAANRLGYALYSEMYRDPARPVNVARFVFLNPQARTFVLDCHSQRRNRGNLRIEAGRNPHDRALTDMVASSMRSEEFRTAGRAQRAPPPQRTQRHPSPVVGDLRRVRALDLPADPGSLVVYTLTLASPPTMAQPPRHWAALSTSRQDRSCRRRTRRARPDLVRCPRSTTAEGLAERKENQ